MTDPYYADGRVTVLHGRSEQVLTTMTDASVDAVVCDPPYELGFMGRTWDASGIAYSVDLWREVFRVLKPGGHLLAFGGTRTAHRLTCAIEDAGFEIRDGIDWLYGSGFPKSMDVSKAIDKAAGAQREVIGEHRRHGGGSENSGSMSGPLGTASVLPLTAPATEEARRWSGWGTALKPAREPIVVARKPLAGTVAANVLEYGAGALNIDSCRVATMESTRRTNRAEMSSAAGRWPLAAGRWPLAAKRRTVPRRQCGWRRPVRRRMCAGLPGRRAGCAVGDTGVGIPGCRHSKIEPRRLEWANASR